MEVAARIAALEHVVMHIGSIVTVATEMTPELVDELREPTRTKLIGRPIDGLIPGYSSLLSAEIADHVDSLWRGIAAGAASMRRGV